MYFLLLLLGLSHPIKSVRKSILTGYVFAAQLENKTLSDFSIVWKDGLVDDIAERVETAQKAGVTQTMSLKTAVAFVQQLEGEALETEVATIEEESKQKTVLPLDDLYPEENIENVEENPDETGG